MCHTLGNVPQNLGLGAFALDFLPAQFCQHFHGASALSFCASVHYFGQVSSISEKHSRKIGKKFLLQVIAKGTFEEHSRVPIMWLLSQPSEFSISVNFFVGGK